MIAIDITVSITPIGRCLPPSPSPSRDPAEQRRRHFLLLGELNYLALVGSSLDDVDVRLGSTSFNGLLHIGLELGGLLLLPLLLISSVIVVIVVFWL